MSKDQKKIKKNLVENVENVENLKNYFKLIFKFTEEEYKKYSKIDDKLRHKIILQTLINANIDLSKFKGINEKILVETK